MSNTISAVPRGLKSFVYRAPTDSSVGYCQYVPMAQKHFQKKSHTLGKQCKLAMSRQTLKTQLTNKAIFARSFAFILAFCLGLALWLGKDLFWGECSLHSSHTHHVFNTLGIDACEKERENECGH